MIGGLVLAAMAACCVVLALRRDRRKIQGMFRKTLEHSSLPVLEDEHGRVAFRNPESLPATAADAPPPDVGVAISPPISGRVLAPPADGRGLSRGDSSFLGVSADQLVERMFMPDSSIALEVADAPPSPPAIAAVAAGCEGGDLSARSDYGDEDVVPVRGANDDDGLLKLGSLPRPATVAPARPSLAPPTSPGYGLPPSSASTDAYPGRRASITRRRLSQVVDPEACLLVADGSSSKSTDSRQAVPVVHLPGGVLPAAPTAPAPAVAVAAPYGRRSSYSGASSAAPASRASAGIGTSQQHRRMSLVAMSPAELPSVPLPLRRPPTGPAMPTPSPGIDGWMMPPPTSTHPPLQSSMGRRRSSLAHVASSIVGAQSAAATAVVAGPPPAVSSVDPTGTGSRLKATSQRRPSLVDA